MSRSKAKSASVSTPPGYTAAKDHFARLPETLALQKKLLSLEALLSGEESDVSKEGDVFEDTDSEEDDEDAAGGSDQDPNRDPGTGSQPDSDDDEEDSDKNDGGAAIGKNPFALLDDAKEWRTFFLPRMKNIHCTVEPLITSSSRDPISIHLRDIARWTTWFEPRCAVPNTLQKADFVTTSGAFDKSRGRKSQYSPLWSFFFEIFSKT